MEFGYDGFLIGDVFNVVPRGYFGFEVVDGFGVVFRKEVGCEVDHERGGEGVVAEEVDEIVAEVESKDFGGFVAGDVIDLFDVW